MGLKDLLVHVDNDPACSVRVDVAAALAARHEAHLTGVHPMGWPRMPGYVEVELPRTFLDEQGVQLEELARQAETRFHEGARRHGIEGEWRVDTGDILGTMKLHARYADLTIVGQGIDLKDAPYDLAFLPQELALGVGRPVLVVPRYGAFETVGERVLVAWNGSREVTRAVHDALPLLKLASNVTVLSIDPQRDTGDRRRGHRHADGDGRAHQPGRRVHPGGRLGRRHGHGNAHLPARLQVSACRSRI